MVISFSHYQPSDFHLQNSLRGGVLGNVNLTQSYFSMRIDKQIPTGQNSSKGKCPLNEILTILLVSVSIRFE